MQKKVIGNLKMNLISLSERDVYLDNLKKEFKLSKLEDTEVIVCVPSVHLETFSKKLKFKNLSIGVQNIFWEDRGSYTGEISAPMVKALGGNYVIVGHGERRKYMSETNDIFNLKIKAALRSELSPIYCIGESLEERGADLTYKVITDQLKTGLKDVTASKAEKIIYVYEPVWSAGTDEVPSSDEILEEKLIIKKILSEIFSAEFANKVAILYGGSITAKIVEDVCLKPEMDGGLIGRESLNPKDFLKIAQIIDKNNLK